MARNLVVKTTSGADAPERCAQAFTVSSIAALSGVSVSLWLTGEASWFALPGKAEAFTLAHSPSLAGLRDDVLEHGILTLCSQCATRRDITPEMTLPGVRLAGAAVFVSEALAEDAQALVY